MSVSVFDLFRVGIGPSSSHTVGPMRAAAAFVHDAKLRGVLSRAARIRLELMGSLAATGRGHATDTAFVLGLMGMAPETVDTSRIPEMIRAVREGGSINVPGVGELPFDWDRDIVFSPEKVARFHTNALEAEALDGAGAVLFRERFYSVGGGFIVRASADDPEVPVVPASFGRVRLACPYKTMAELLEIAKKENTTIAGIVRMNEESLAGTAEGLDARLDEVWRVMWESIDRGLSASGVLPGPYAVARRAKSLAARLESTAPDDPLDALDWTCAFAFAVGEVNAAGGRVVTAPTNGAAGVVPAVIEYYRRFVRGAGDAGVREFLLTAGAVGGIFKTNGSISGAEVGCQGEVGVACSMAAAGLAAAMGGTLEQVENAAEIGIEHHLGLTCDPVAGQVQIPCIERNAMAAVSAVTAARLSLAGTGHHRILLDEAVKTMIRTGRDMSAKYKETSAGGLAVCVVEC